MNREIKFRTWTGRRFWFFDISSGFNTENADTFSSPEQFTGLKDRAGIDIYEGDFVSHDSVHHEMLVSFRNSKWVLVQRPSCGSELEGECLCDNLCDFDNNELTVVGNIHVNTEMLG